jgi:hypothetical protein
LEALRIDEVSAAGDQRGKQDEVEQQGPAGAESVGAEEDLAPGEARRRRQNRRGKLIAGRVGARVRAHGGLGWLRLVGLWLVCVRQVGLLG